MHGIDNKLNEIVTLSAQRLAHGPNPLEPAETRPTIMDKSVDTLEQNKRFLSASFRNLEKHLFC